MTFTFLLNDMHMTSVLKVSLLLSGGAGPEKETSYMIPLQQCCYEIKSCSIDSKLLGRRRDVEIVITVITLNIGTDRPEQMM